MELEGVRDALAELLREGGLNAQTSWPRARRSGPEEPVVLVSLQALSCGPAGLQDYLGLRLDEATGRWEELYGRKAELVFGLDILAPAQAGAQACREVFARMAEALQAGLPAGLRARALTAEETEYDSKEGLLKLRAELKCQGWLCAAGEESGTFLDFTLRGDVKA